ncbi:MAG: hypothetical protein RL641_142 [Candidatus Parcubacteria bacterium]|jgi:hypothetical protein
MENQIKTTTDFDDITNECLDLMFKKRLDYGDAWEILRPSSLTDQIFIKAKRIRSVQEKKSQKVKDNLKDEFVGMLNYSLMGISQLEKRASDTVEQKYQTIVGDIKKLLEIKNHDYGEAWRDLRISSITDLILQKLMRLRQMETNGYEVKVSEHARSSYEDIVNYCVFALILIKEGADPMK